MDEFRVEDGKLDEAEQEFLAVGKQFDTFAEQLETQLKGIATSAWQDPNSPARAQFERKAENIKAKLEVINQKFEKNKAVFAAVKEFVNKFEANMATHIEGM